MELVAFVLGATVGALVALFFVCAPTEEPLDGLERHCCPFHEERTASLVLDRRADRFFCYGCGAEGTVSSFEDARQARRQHAPWQSTAL